MDSSSKSFTLCCSCSLYDCHKETRKLIETVLESISYNDFLWEVCCDFKMISVLVGLQAGYENDRFHGDLKKLSDQYGERFHQSIAVFESRYACSSSL